MKMPAQVVVPSWMGKVIITALIGALVTGALGWAQSTSKELSEHDKDIAVQKTDLGHMKENISDVKDSQRRIEDKLDKALLRR